MNEVPQSALHNNQITSSFTQNTNSEQTQKQSQNTVEKNTRRQCQIILSIIITILCTLQVQITMQHTAPFVRTSQNYFNCNFLDHSNQDIYEASDVIFWRTQQYNILNNMVEMFKRIEQTVLNLHSDSLFRINNQSSVLNEAQVILVLEYNQNFRQSFVDFSSNLDDIGILFDQSVFLKSSYEHIKKIDLTIKIPIFYRDNPSTLQVWVKCQFFSSILMKVKVDTDLKDENEILIQDQENLQIRKRADQKNLQLELRYLRWIIFLLFFLLFYLQLSYLLKRNTQLDKKIKEHIKNQNESIIEHFEVSIKYRLSKIGSFYFMEAAVSLLGILFCSFSIPGMICLFSWIKLVVYLSQTKNSLMLGFLFSEAIPIYLVIVLNLMILITAFVLFDMLLYQNTNKFQTLQMSYYEYFFNYFQYGIYQNFILAFRPFGLFAQAFYLIQLIILLSTGNNIFMSILASEVNKNSNVQSIQMMVKDARGECPMCGYLPKKDRQVNIDENGIKKMQNSRLFSKILQKYNFKQRKSDAISEDSEFNIVVKSPVLSPFFPKRHQKQKEKDFLTAKKKKPITSQKLQIISQQSKKIIEFQSQNKLLSAQQIKFGQFGEKNLKRKKVNINIEHEQKKDKERFQNTIKQKMTKLRQHIQLISQTKKYTLNHFSSKKQLSGCKLEIFEALRKNMDQLFEKIKK